MIWKTLKTPKHPPACGGILYIYIFCWGPRMAWSQLFPVRPEEARLSACSLPAAQKPGSVGGMVWIVSIPSIDCGTDDVFDFGWLWMRNWGVLFLGHIMQKYAEDDNFKRREWNGSRTWTVWEALSACRQVARQSEAGSWDSTNSRDG